jgi:hypothetical protein
MQAILADQHEPRERVHIERKTFSVIGGIIANIVNVEHYTDR